MIKLKILTLFYSLIVCVSLYATDTSYDKTGHIYKNLDYLNLNQEQEKKIKDILIGSKKEFSTYYEKKLKVQKELQKLIQEEHFNEEKYEDLSEHLLEDAIEIEITLFKQIHKILNPSQREQFSHYLQEWKVE
jgi:Spy/CpxP family protein refolding chaperone